MAADPPALRMLMLSILGNVLASAAAASAASAVEVSSAPAQDPFPWQLVASPPLCERNPNHHLCADADNDRFCERRLDHPLCDRARFCGRRPDHPLCDDGQPPSPS